MAKDNRKIAAILAADVVEYSRLMGVDEPGTFAALKVRRAMFERLVQEFDGQEFGSVGDSLMAQFPSALNAVRCARNVQQAIAEVNDSLPADRHMQLRIGVNLGDVIEENGVLFGDAVNIAARLQAMAAPGGVFISGAVYEQVKNKLSVSFKFVGARRVKNITEPVACYEVAEPIEASLAQRVAAILKRRVVTTAEAYVVLSLIIIVAVKKFATAAGAPTWTLPALMTVLAAGLVLALAVASRSDRRYHPWLRPLVTGIAVIVTVAGWQWWWQLHWVAPTADVPPNSVAVLRFVNLGSPAEDYRSIGLSLELLNLFTRLRELHVSSQVSSFAPQSDAAQIRQRLAVRYFVEGSYRQAGAEITVEAQLVDTETGYRLWSESIKGGSEALVEAPAAIARRVVKSLDVKLSRESLQQLQTAPTKSAVALDHYLRGNQWLRAPTDSATLASAEREFLEAIKLDQAFAMPYSGLCRVHLIRYQRGHDVEQFSGAEADCQRTLSLNELQADPYKALGELYLASGRIDDAESQYRTAQRLSSRDAEAAIGLAEVASGRGRLVDAERGFRRAVALEPHYWRTYAALGRFLFTQARFNEAASAYERLTELNPANRDAWSGLGSARYMDGDFDHALVAWQKALALSPSALEYSNVGTAYFFLGRLRESARMYERALELEPKDHRYWGHIGDVRELLGQREPAKSAFEKAADLARQNLGVNAEDIETRVQLAGYDAALGRGDLAKSALAETLTPSQEDPYLYYDAAVAYTRLRMSDRALDALAVAVKGGYPRRLVVADPQFESLRALERFSQIAQ